MKKRSKDKLLGWLMVSPWILGLLAFVVWAGNELGWLFFIGTILFSTAFTFVFMVLPIMGLHKIGFTDLYR